MNSYNLDKFFEIDLPFYKVINKDGKIEDFNKFKSLIFIYRCSHKKGYYFIELADTLNNEFIVELFKYKKKKKVEIISTSEIRKLIYKILKKYEL